VTVHDVHFLAPGTYTSLLGVTQAVADAAALAAGLAPGSISAYDMTVGANQIGATMLWDFGPNKDSPIITLWDIDDSTPGMRKLIPLDIDGDGIVGAKSVYIDTGHSYVFNITTTAVPVPAAAWLFGSGLLGLVGVARRRNKAAA